MNMFTWTRITFATLMIQQTDGCETNSYFILCFTAVHPQCIVPAIWDSDASVRFLFFLHSGILLIQVAGDVSQTGSSGFIILHVLHAFPLSLILMTATVRQSCRCKGGPTTSAARIFYTFGRSCLGGKTLHSRKFCIKSAEGLFQHISKSCSCFQVPKCYYCGLWRKRAFQMFIKYFYQIMIKSIFGLFKLIFP